MANALSLTIDNVETPKFKTAKLEDVSVWIVEDRDTDDQVFEQKEDENPVNPCSSVDQVEVSFQNSRGSKIEKERKIGHRRVGVGGEVTYKRIQTSQIMGSIQLGIQHTVGALVSKPERDILMQDFMTVEIISFTPKGSSNTPAHPYQEFVFKTYGPNAFRYFRDLFGIRPDDFLVSFCSSVMRELSNPGASGSIFYMTADDNFILKTIQHKEGKFLQKLLPGYYMNLNQNPRTLLPKFFGLYCYQCKTKNIRMVAMNNLLPSSVALHQKYDLKGSTYKRKASKVERQKKLPTYKDLDFMEHHSEGIFLDSEIYNSLFKTIQRDCRVLESFQIMDYSLLIGVHNLDEAEKERCNREHVRRKTDSLGDSDEERSEKSSLNGSTLHHRLSYVASSSSKHPSTEDDLLTSGIPAKSAKGERLVLFIGIIDILQSYHLKKKLEHAWKSIIQDGDTVSVVRPNFYSQRFQDFMSNRVFKKSVPTPKNSPPRRRTANFP